MQLTIVIVPHNTKKSKTAELLNLQDDKKDKYINQGAVEHSDEFNEQASSEGWL